MTPSEFLKTIYLGDRACKGVFVHSWTDEVKIQVDCISRIRGETWNFHNKENLDDGYIVFEGVENIDLEGGLPNDEIIALSVKPANIPGLFVFDLKVASARAGGFADSATRLSITARNVCLERAETAERIRN